MYENVVAVYKSAQDVYFYVLGGYDENELILLSALTCLFDALSRLLRCVRAACRATNTSVVENVVAFSPMCE